MIIGTCGFCSTGSSAVSDYLKEFDENQVLDGVEFTYVYLPDGLEDLYYHTTNKISRDDSSSIAIPRFKKFIKHYEKSLCANTKLTKEQFRTITESFIESIIQLRWKGTNRSDSLLFDNIIRRYIGISLFEQRIIPYLNRKLHRCVEMYPMRDLEISIMPDAAEEKYRNYVTELLKAIGADYSKNIVLDQPFVGNDPVSSFHFYEDPYAIVVDRDPRDNYIFAKEFLFRKKKYMPTNNVQEFVKYYRLMRDNMPYKLDNPRVLRINFEDMVYDYSNATRKIREFLGLRENPHPRSVFDPALSINNTQLILKFPQYKQDVEYIEKELSDYLFDFDKYPKPDNSGKMFMGKSPLNR